MSIGRIGVEAPRTVLPRVGDTGEAESPSRASFAETLSRALADVNQSQLASDDASIRLATGQAESLHEVVLATEKANLALQFTMAIRNKILDAYNEIMRMPV